MINQMTVGPVTGRPFQLNLSDSEIESGTYSYMGIVYTYYRCKQFVKKLICDRAMDGVIDAQTLQQTERQTT